ncbi:MAG: hypothetical protein GXP18_02190 [Gammaproteobacteria bacterium]|nr:hypothetical protein [Gammaproteobacteria bacterium]
MNETIEFEMSVFLSPEVLFLVSLNIPNASFSILPESKTPLTTPET